MSDEDDSLELDDAADAADAQADAADALDDSSVEVTFTEDEFADLYAERVGISAPTRCEFLTGAAGSGKSYEILRRIEEDPAYAILSASTGIAAVNLNATTIHSLLGFFDTDSLRDAYLHGSAERKLRELVVDGYRNVVLDEISMVSHDTLDILVKVFDAVNDSIKQTQHPIGLILVGDFCLAPSTKVMRADGSLCSASEVRVGDRLMGPDFKPRTVKRTVKGSGKMFEVKQTNGDTYAVNAGHRLALRRGINGSRRDMGRSRNIRYPKATAAEFPMAVLEFVTKSKKFRECFVGYRAGCVPLPCRGITIDPYFLGLWLGDGDKEGPRITAGGADLEVVDFCAKYAKKLGMRASLAQDGEKFAIRIRITNVKRGNAPNPLWEKFRDYDLPRNKHIPADYQLNCVQVRLELLAGILDADGSWGGNRYTIASARKPFAESIKQLADQLGFRAAIRPITWGVAAGRAWTVTIGGDTWRIPCKVKRKISVKRNLGRNRLTSVLSVTPIKNGRYAGFEVEGDNRFLLADGTVTYNCQLPPIVDRAPGKRAKAASPWAFDAVSWPRFAENTVRLTKNWRQTETDSPSSAKFIAALNYARAGHGAAAVAELVSAGLEFSTFVDMEFDGTTLLSENKAVDIFNLEAMKRVRGRDMVLPSRRWGKLRGEWEKIPEKTQVREGAYVMLLANRSTGARGQFEYVNGDCGHIRGLSAHKYGGMPAVQVELVRTGTVVNVPMVVRAVDHRAKPDGFVVNEKVGEAGVSGDVYLPKQHYNTQKKRYVSGQVQYYPIRLAWATTVHKSQSLSLNRVQVDMRSWMFSQPAMAYIAMSRCRTLEGLRIVGMKEVVAEKCKSDPRVSRWL